jgi:starch-binding outer membrane protein, SusD/RagB family
MSKLKLHINKIMRFRLLPVLSVAALAACSSVLDVPPTNQIPADVAIANAVGARAALTGAYSGLQATGLYGHELLDWTELLSDNTTWVGTFDDWADADFNSLRADNITLEEIWDNAYDEINRVNNIIQKVPGVTDLADDEKNEILGEAYFLRALVYHDLVRLWGGVPLRTEPVASAEEAGSITRASVAETYTQIHADLAQAEQLITADPSQTRRASLGAAYALEARVRLYEQDWAGAEAAAKTVEDMGYELAPNFSDLFDATGNSTPEDIFRVTFTSTQSNSLGFYYLPKVFGGRYEVAPQQGPGGILDAFDPASGGDSAAYNPTDARGIWSVQVTSKTWGAKFRNPSGDEDVHVIRLGEVILIRAEALAHLNRLPEAVDEYNRLRVRAGLAPDPTTGLTQAGVLAAIARERRLELAFEGDRWPDLVRTGEAITLLGLTQQQTLLPIPQNDIDTAPGITQNPGY